jgi:hypothetical protein
VIKAMIVKTTLKNVGNYLYLDEHPLIMRSQIVEEKIFVHQAMLLVPLYWQALAMPPCLQAFRRFWRASGPVPVEPKGIKLNFRDDFLLKKHGGSRNCLNFENILTQFLYLVNLLFPQPAPGAGYQWRAGRNQGSSALSRLRHAMTMPGKFN